MRVGVLGTGEVGKALSGRFAELGHDVVMGTRDVEATLAKAESWFGEHPEVRLVTQAEAAARGEIIVNANSGHGSIPALTNAGEQNLAGKVLMDVSNSLDFSQGFPPSLFVTNTDSLAEQIQREFPSARVVKTLNTVANAVMIHPEQVADGDHTVFVSGNDAEAKSVVSGVLSEFGWRDIVDLGDLTTARGPEMLLALWVRLFPVVGHGNFNVKVVR